MARFKALIRGQTPDGTWHSPGSVFETDAPQGKWMEAIGPLDHDGDGKKGGTVRAKAKPVVGSDD